MQKRTRVIFTFAALVVLVAGLYFFTNWFSIVTGYLKGEDSAASLASCLSSQGAEFYGNEFCVDCEKQALEFGIAFEKIHYIDCGREKENCPNLREIPAWFINGKIHYSYKSLDELKELSSC